MGVTQKTVQSYQEILDESLEKFFSDLDRALPNLFNAQTAVRKLNMPIEVGILIATIEQVSALRDSLESLSDRVDVILGEENAKDAK